MTDLTKLKPVIGIVYRGIPISHKQNIEDIYKEGSRIHWSAFTSTTKLSDRAKYFARGRIIFRIKCRTGRLIREYSAFPNEEEVILSPNCRLTVTDELHWEEDGYYLDLWNYETTPSFINIII